MARQISVSGVDLEVEERGTGRPLLFLHPGEGLGVRRPWLDALAAGFRVIAPWHPGWGNSALPDWLGTVDDLAYLYLDLIRQLKLENVVLAGADFGGWVAAEMAVRDTRGIGALVLAAPVGIKTGGVTERDIADVHSMPRAKALELAWADPALGAEDYAAMTDMELAGIARGRESWALFGWKPYMHNPRLKNWLHRIDVPTTLIWGTRDRVTLPSYGTAWRDAIAGAKLLSIDNAGHFPHWEKPDEFAQAVRTACA
jgi:pimeloyl-ACP methyl ester carboxylesterase